MSSVSCLVPGFTNSNFTVLFTRDKKLEEIWFHSMVDVQHFTTKMLKACKDVHNMSEIDFKKVKSFTVLYTPLRYEHGGRKCLEELYTKTRLNQPLSFQFCDVTLQWSIVQVSTTYLTEYMKKFQKCEPRVVTSLSLIHI